MKNNYEDIVRNNEKAFNQHKKNGFHITFPNGNKLSTIWGYSTYSDNYNMDDIAGYMDRFDIIRGSDTCEVMPSCSDEVKQKLDEMFPEETSGSVFGHLSFEQWLKMVNYLNENK